jgi:hypothetical protein
MNKKTALAALALTCAGVAHAATVNLTYNGISSRDPNPAVTGTGQFVTKAGFDIGDIGVDELASFNFSFSFTHGGRTDVFNYTLADLTCTDNPFVDCGFNAVLTDTGVASLSLQTEEHAAQFLWAQSLTVETLARAFTGNFDMAPLSNGSITATLANEPAPLPEPASWALAGLALGAGVFASRRRAR